MTITVFLADDHTMVRDGLRMIIESQPEMEIIGDAANGREAVSKIRELCPDVAILDIAMPELNGIEAARQLYEACPDTRVIVFSMHNNSKHIFYALRAGVRGYLLKEAAGAEVVEAIRAVYQGHRYLSETIDNSHTGAGCCSQNFTFTSSSF